VGDLSVVEFSTALLVFRVLFGFVFALHGWGKVKGGIDGTAGWFDSMGMRPGRLHAWAAALTEMGTGLLLALGLLTSFAAAGMVGVMVVAGWTVHRHNGFMIVKDGWEYTFVVAATATFLAWLGPGDYSIDAVLDLADSFNGWTGLGIALVLGVGAGVAQLVAFYRPPATAS
jgi:putative oxidoreductase